MRCTKTTTGTSRIPLYGRLPSSSAASRKSDCFTIQVLPVPGPARHSTGYAACAPTDRRGDGWVSRLTSCGTSRTDMYSGGLQPSCTSMAAMKMSCSLICSSLPVIASSTLSSVARMNSQ